MNQEVIYKIAVISLNGLAAIDKPEKTDNQMVQIPTLTYLSKEQTLLVMCSWEINQVWARNEYMLYASIQPGTMDAAIITKLANFYNAYFK